MHILTWFMIAIMPGGWILFGVYKLYTMFIQKRSYDTQDFNDMLSNLVMYRKGHRHKPYVGSFICLTPDVARVIVLKDGSLTREFL